ncbi:flavodoxin [Couchioplanes caeruleus]|uniref:flavodoxin family protein n=1 Tax=Couchioplanes caeruleus TaxID=56438 RepID=UPI0020BFE638|nr:flavodoxin [Couchioplanes caeruleus]UQU61840.1 flavodoxin [Couchioplanes caeruleus]
MKALIIFESMFGNTRSIACAIAEGLQETYEVNVADVSGRPRAYGIDLLVVGGPTHAFSMSRASTREDAARKGTVRQGSAGTGLRDYFDSSPVLHGIPAAAFDTKINKPLVPGSAARRAQKELRRLGCRIVLPAENFLVTDTTGPLVEGERERARQWGAALAAAAAEHRDKV